MEIGVNIQTLRKRDGLSQEELANQLFVSRQTVSQWETGQTVPSVENLDRLREIFGVSMDALFYGQMEKKSPDADRENAPTWTYRLDASSAKSISASLYLFPLPSLFLFFLLLATAMIAEKANILFWAFTCVLFLSLVLCLFLLFCICRKKLTESAAVTEYRYTLESGALRIAVFRRTERVHEQLIRKTDRLRHYRNGRFVLFACFGRFYFFPKQWLAAYEPLADFFRVEQADGPAASKQARTLSVLLVIFSAISLFLGPFTAMLLASQSENMAQALPQNCWPVFLLMQIPVLSVVFFFLQRKKGFQFRKNLVVGLIMALLLLVVGLAFLSFMM